MATDLESFLNTPPILGDFAHNALRAAVEISQGEGQKIELVPSSNGTDRLVRHEPDTKSAWESSASFESSNNLRDDLNKAVETSEENHGAIFYRGSKMPDGTMGSFGLNEMGVHLAPYLSSAQGYAISVNSQTGIGTLLRMNGDRYAVNGDAVPSLGFITTWKLPFDHHVWRNFEYEDKKGIPDPGQLTIGGVLQEMRRIASLPDNAFKTTIDDDGFEIIPVAKREVSELFNDRAYEAISRAGQLPEEQFLQFYDGRHAHLIKIDPKNPKWDQWMARVYEANVRDFYEIKPLKEVVNRLENMRKDDIFYGNREAYNELLTETNAMYNDALKKPFTMNSMKDAPGFVENHPWVKDSRRVGSESGKVCLPPTINDITQKAYNIKRVGIVRNATISRAAEILIGGEPTRKDSYGDQRIGDDVERMVDAKELLAKGGYDLPTDALTQFLDQTRDLVKDDIYSIRRSKALQELMREFDEGYHHERESAQPQQQQQFQQTPSADQIAAQQAQRQQQESPVASTRSASQAPDTKTVSPDAHTNVPPPVETHTQATATALIAMPSPDIAPAGQVPAIGKSASVEQTPHLSPINPPHAGAHAAGGGAAIAMSLWGLSQSPQKEEPQTYLDGVENRTSIGAGVIGVTDGTLSIANNVAGNPTASKTAQTVVNTVAPTIAEAAPKTLAAMQAAAPVVSRLSVASAVAVGAVGVVQGAVDGDATKMATSAGLVAGAFAGAESGTALGAAMAGPYGAVIGGAVGGIAGAMGFETILNTKLRPIELTAEQKAFFAFVDGLPAKTDASMSPELKALVEAKANMTQAQATLDHAMQTIPPTNPGIARNALESAENSFTGKFEELQKNGGVQKVVAELTERNHPELIQHASAPANDKPDETSAFASATLRTDRDAPKSRDDSRPPLRTVLATTSPNASTLVPDRRVAIPSGQSPAP